MADILVQNVSEEVVHELRRRAAAHGRSVEDESRAILEEATSRRRTAGAEWAELFAGTGIGELDPEELRDRSDTGRSTYVSLEGLERFADLLKRG